MVSGISLSIDKTVSEIGRLFLDEKKTDYNVTFFDKKMNEEGVKEFLFSVVFVFHFGIFGLGIGVER